MSTIREQLKIIDKAIDAIEAAVEVAEEKATQAQADLCLVERQVIADIRGAFEQLTDIFLEDESIDDLGLALEVLGQVIERLPKSPA